MSKTVAVIPGDGIGPEVVDAALQVLDALDLEIDYLHADAGLACYQREGAYLPEATLTAVRAADAVLFGAITSADDVLRMVVGGAYPYFFARGEGFPAEMEVRGEVYMPIAAFDEKLPDILEYRLLSEALILRDVKANIIVDFIPNAIQ